MERCEASLESFQNQIFTEAEVAYVGHSALKALEYLHDLGSLGACRFFGGVGFFFKDHLLILAYPVFASFFAMF